MGCVMIHHLGNLAYLPNLDKSIYSKLLRVSTHTCTYIYQYYS